MLSQMDKMHNRGNYKREDSKELKTKVTIRLTNEEKAKLSKQAEKKNTTVSDVIREMVNKSK